MKRRTFLATGAASLTAVAGCLGGGGGDELPVTPSDGDLDGYPPEYDDVPDERDVDTSSFSTTTQKGVEVPLVPVDVAKYWHARREARFADARGEKQYKASRVDGAVLSPAEESALSDDADAVTDWPKDDRIVAYCGCPHHLSGIRAARLIDAGYEEVYIIDEGFWEWHDRDYPMQGEDIDERPESWVIRGETDPNYARDDAWAYHDPTGQTEATGITDDGTYELHLTFHDVGPDSTVEVETPAYSVEGTLADLSVGTVRG
ncbi:rhodanese-like domain-containing protein [Halorussus salilacus]|uniref:rhodanese-like domain-containing protein n=1 Tax=Halorussus salilacus TaxID=2953750 RepID=UPI00209CA9E1|nr:rhodanese-like domain-containing protein [Halorussus salilacus]USZ68366.1 rhodanese-like domain-containing protein [Halorussus salilacus]